jgi:abortive infection bacteriophage resistance protein
MGVPPVPIRYTKPWLSIPQQAERLIRRGLVVADRASCEAFLGHLNYYRFSGYCLAFHGTRGTFRPGTTFEQVQGACVFDAILRDLFTEALELIEIDLRTVIANYFGRKYGAFGQRIFTPDSTIAHGRTICAKKQNAAASYSLRTFDPDTANFQTFQFG